MRREVKEGIGSAAEHRRSIDKFHNVLSTEWTTKNEEMLNQNSDGSGIDESASAILEFVSNNVVLSDHRGTYADICKRLYSST